MESIAPLNFLLEDSAILDTNSEFLQNPRLFFRKLPV